jgi:hypothetical protein
VSEIAPITTTQVRRDITGELIMSGGPAGGAFIKTGKSRGPQGRSFSGEFTKGHPRHRLRSLYGLGSATSAFKVSVRVMDSAMS